MTPFPVATSTAVSYGAASYLPAADTLGMGNASALFGADAFSSHLQSAAADDSQASDTQQPADNGTPAHSTNDASGDKQERPKAKANRDAAALLGVPVPYQQVLDDRKLQLSAPDKDAAQTAARHAGIASGGLVPLDAAPKNGAAKTAAASKGNVAFGANLRVNASEVQAGTSHGGTQTAAAGKSAGAKNHGGGQNGGDEEATPKKDSAPTPPASNVAQAHTGAAHTATPASASVVPAQAGAAYATNTQASAKPLEAAPAAANTPVPDTAAPGAQNKTIDVQVSSAADDNAVNVRISQRAGDVQVTVRTPDTDLAQSLRQHLPELSTRLAESGVHGDLWQPSAASATNDSPSDGGSGEDRANDSGTAGQNAFGDAQGHQKQQEKNQSAWLNQMYGAESGR